MSTLELRPPRVGPVDSAGAAPVLRRNMPELDAVRGLAVLAVFFYHAFYWSNKGTVTDGPGRWFLRATQLGWLGVDLFFVLSGLLITGLLLDTRRLSVRSFFRSFYARRALRILPLYYLVLCVASAALWARGEMSVAFFSLSVAYLSNVALMLNCPAGYPLAVLWSLAIEEHFYIFWPWLVRFLSWRALALAAGLLCVGEPALRALSVSRGWLDGDGVYVATWLRLDGFAWGALLAIFVRSRFCNRRRLGWLSVLFACGCVLLVLAGRGHGIMTRKAVLGSALQFSCASALFAAFIAGMLVLGSGACARWVVPRPLRYFGRISYCLYLIHQLCFWCFDMVLVRLGLSPVGFFPDRFASLMLRGLLVMGAAVGLAEVSRRYFEGPFLARKVHFPGAYPEKR